MNRHHARRKEADSEQKQALRRLAGEASAERVNGDPRAHGREPMPGLVGDRLEDSTFGLRLSACRPCRQLGVPRQ